MILVYMKKCRVRLFSIVYQQQHTANCQVERESCEVSWTILCCSKVSKIKTHWYQVILVSSVRLSHGKTKNNWHWDIKSLKPWLICKFKKCASNYVLATLESLVEVYPTGYLIMLLILNVFILSPRDHYFGYRLIIYLIWSIAGGIARLWEHYS